MTVLPSHLEEWRSSGVDQEIIHLNVVSPEGKETLAQLVPDIDSASNRVHPDAQWRWLNQRYEELGLSGWWCSGIDLLTMQDAVWGCFKSDNPRIDSNKSELLLTQCDISSKLHLNLVHQNCWLAWGISLKIKPIKYEHPSGTSTQVFALKVPSRIWRTIALRYNVALPEDFENLPHSDFWRWMVDNPAIPVILTEGAKKAGAILSRGYVGLALPGVRSGYRIPKDSFGNKDGMPFLIPQLKVLAQKGRRIYFCFDSDEKQSTIRDVNNSLTQTSKLFIKEGCQVNVISWNELLGKGIDDVIVAHGQEQFDELYRNALPFDDWSSLQLKRLTYKPNLILNQRYLGEFIPPTSAKLIALKAPKGSGKTEWMKFITDGLIRSGERQVIGITHRVQLGLMTAQRLGISFISEISATRDRAEKTALTAGGMFLCIDSLHGMSQARFNPDNYKGCWVILDEICQMIWHLLTAETEVKKHRVTIIKNLKSLLQNAEKIIVADADLNDVAIDFIRCLIGYDAEYWIVENQYKFEENSWTIHNFNTDLEALVKDNPAALIKALKDKLSAGEKHMLCVSGQTHKSKWGSINLEEYFKKELPELKILRIDSVSVTTPNHPAFRCTCDLNQVLIDGQYDLVICTPTVETGVSIDVDVFHGVWGIFQGIQTCDSVRQHLSRYRLPVPRYVWLKLIGLNRVGNGSTTVKGLLASEYKKNKVVIKQLLDAEFDEIIDDGFEPICIKTWAKMGCIINLGMKDYRNQILADFIVEGHTIVDALNIPCHEIEETKADVTYVRDVNYLAYRERVADAKSPTEIELERLSRQQEKTETERERERKGFLSNRYLVPITPELIGKDDDGWFSQIKLHYYFAEGREFLPDYDKKVMSKALASGSGQYFMIDTNSSQIGTKVATLDYLGIGDILRGDEFSENHPVIQELFSKCQKHSWEIKTLLGIDFSGEHKPMRVAQRLLATIGLKMPCLRREGARGNRVRIYGTPGVDFVKDDEGRLMLDDGGRAIPIDDSRQEIFKAWLVRDAEAREKAQKAKAAAVAAAAAAAVAAAVAAAAAEAAAESQNNVDWFSEESQSNLIALLAECENSEMLSELRFIPSPALRLAAKSLDAAKCQWVSDWLDYWEMQENYAAA